MNPYRHQHDHAFWSRAVARDWRPAALFNGAAPLLVPEDRIASAGSCFAANIVPYLEAAGYAYVRTETMDAADDRFFYGRYSAAYGNVYTARQFLQLVERCLGRFEPTQDRWRTQAGVIDPFRPGLPYPAADDDEFDAVTAAHLRRTLAAFREASVLVFTLGLTEAWVCAEDGAVFPVCPGVVAGEFDPQRHRFLNFRAAEIAQDFRAALAALREINLNLRVILTVSPVPLAATATAEHVYVANFYSKAALRAAAEEIVATTAGVAYFPSLEIVLGLEAAASFEPDLRSVSAAGVSRVIDSLFAHCRLPERPGPRAGDAAEALSRELVRRECEEALTDPTAPREQEA